MYQIIFITNLPSFYKINLYNKINQQKKILVLFTGYSSEMRRNDFFAGNIEFDYITIENYSLIMKFKTIWKIINTNSYDELIISGLNEMTSWFAVFISPIKMNSTVIESSIFETKSFGIRFFLKTIFFKRISIAYVSGKAQEKYAKLYNYKGKVVITKGVGVFNIVDQPKYLYVNKVSEFIYVGRLSPEKNLIFLIEVFNKLPQFKLHIVGYGPQEEYLSSIANENIVFHGAVENRMLPELYQKCHVFILPSIKEPWGLVVEEAFNNGLPVIVSDKVGCAEEIVEVNRNGLIFDYNSETSLLENINRIVDLDFYNSLRYNVSKMDFNQVVEHQVNCYVNNSLH